VNERKARQTVKGLDVRTTTTSVNVWPLRQKGSAVAGAGAGAGVGAGAGTEGSFKNHIFFITSITI